MSDGAPLALYLHIPFCQRRCTYCDFNTYAGLEPLHEPYANALAKEIRQVGQGERVATIFLGGGTPSILPLPLVAGLLTACREVFDIEDQAEISLEANPGTMDEPQLGALHKLGFNRVSLGVQSSQPNELLLLGRSHTFDQAVQAVAIARSAGFENVSVDLIYGLPRQSLKDWKETLDAILAQQMRPDHLSAYCLTLEEGTHLAAMVASGQMPEPDPDVAAEMYELAERTLDKAGFRHYEISNWAKPEKECRHNLVYWRNGEYLGFGAGAHSHRRGRRWWNVLTPAEYIARIQAGKAPEAGGEETGAAQAMAETMMLGLRLTEGVTAVTFRERFDRDLEAAYGRELEELAVTGLVEWDGHRARLTPRGRLLGNQVFVRFLP